MIIAKNQVTSYYRKVQNLATKTKGWLGEKNASKMNLGKWYGPGRVLFLPGGLLDKSDIPPYLNGDIAGDYGYDPLGLGDNTEQVLSYRKAELIHARWAMLASTGILIPEGLQSNGAGLIGGTWFETGAYMLNDGRLNYFAVPWGIISNPLPLFVVVLVKLVLMASVEGFRSTGKGPSGYSPCFGSFNPTIFDGMDSLYPGGPFDPLDLGDDPEVLAELKVKEIKNGRLAMISVLAFAMQSFIVGEGPYANLSKHVVHPFGYNLATILTTEDRSRVL